MRCRPWDLPHPEVPSKQGSMHQARTASVLAPFLFCRQYFLDADLQGSLSKLANTCKSSVDFFLSSVRLRHDSRDGAAMSCNNERFSPLHVIEQLRQAGFGFRRLNLAHKLF